MSHLNCPRRIEVVQEGKEAARTGKDWGAMPKEYDNAIEGLHWRIGFFQELDRMEQEMIKRPAPKVPAKTQTPPATASLETFFNEVPKKPIIRKPKS